MKNVHIISHSHWDREWYMPFEYHRAYLVKLIDDCLELFEKDKDFKGFHLDGHTILVEDYLEIKPENEELIKKYVSEGRFAMGPWYVLQDEFLTSSEANIRNLLVGISIAEKFGKVTPIGYFPDSFGNVGQMPQILKQAGMKAIAFGRGVKPTGMNNSVSDGYNSQFSELYWQSPDGSTLPAILFANWYNNGMELPEDGNKEYWEKKLEGVERYASTDELLLMNGCDHQPVQKNLTSAINAAKENNPEYNFIHSSFEKYAEALAKALPESLSTIQGELIGQDTDGWFTLVNTCSSHVDLKVMNRNGEILLENAAEPLSVIAAQLGKKYPHEMLLYSWKTLMQNHPHDSICGCSCDEVNDEMRTRFIKSRQAAEAVIKDNLKYIAQHIDKSGFDGCDAVFTVINTFGKKRCGIVSADVDVRRFYGSAGLRNSAGEIKKTLYTGEYELVDESGNVVSCTSSDARLRFGYDLPEDRFRQPYMAETVTITFEACDIPAMGYKVYGIRKKASAEKTKSLVKEANTMENDYIKVLINTDGTVDVTDKSTKRTFSGLLRLEDVGDIGTEYTFIPAQGDTPILSGNTPAEIELVKNEEFLAEYKVTVSVTIPKSADKTAIEEKSVFIEGRARQGKRDNETVTMPITFYISLSENSKRLDVKCEFENTAKDHRLRVLFPTGLECTKHKAESVFEAAERNNVHKPCWTYPSGCEHQQGFVMMQDSSAGLAVANIGLYEYEITGDNSIAVTLVRAVAELGDWGVFPTELSQQQKKLALEFAIIPFGSENDAYTEAASFQNRMCNVQVVDNTSADYRNNQFVWSGDSLRLTCFKAAQDSDDIIMRWVNYSDKEQKLVIDKTEWIDNLYASNVIEKKGEVLKYTNGSWEITVKPFEIVTFGCAK
ncbi:MAG: alpha-mannosidase [Clostridia bacterium]|nr:alpha-mannosidase [Clostridia bacterium]